MESKHHEDIHTARRQTCRAAKINAHACPKTESAPGAVHPESEPQIHGAVPGSHAVPAAGVAVGTGEIRTQPASRRICFQKSALVFKAREQTISAWRSR